MAFSTAKAQVDGVNIVVSPHASYNWWNENIALKDSPFYGLRLGVGFGPYFEIRGTFEKSINLKSALEDQKWNPFNPDQLQKMEGMDIDVSRFGGELKFNLLNNYKLAPYLTVGGGVQVMDYNPFNSDVDQIIEEIKTKESQLYLSAGLGLKVNLSDRLALSLEGRHLRFNMDQNNHLLNPEVNEDSKRWGNWSALASLDIYLGGSTGFSTLPDGYRNLYTDGFQGIKFVLEPGLLYADFKEKTGRPDQWFLGGSAGIDFSSLVGIRAFYYQATEQPNKLSFNFNNDLRMYGVNLIARLNQPRGIVPYLQLGAGYLDDNNFITTGGDSFKTHNLFLMGGAGVEVPLSRFVALYGTVNALLSTESEAKLEDINTPSDIATNLAYTAGVRINLGKPAYVPIQEHIAGVSADDLNDRVNDEQRSAARATTRTTLFGREQGRSQFMTKQEFEEMVDRILIKIRNEESARASNFSESEMDIIVAALNAQNNTQQATAPTASDVTNQQLVNEMRRLVERLDNQSRYQGNISQVTPIHRVDPVVTAPVVAAPAGTVPGNQVPTPQVVRTTARSEFLKLNRLGAVTGLNLGEGTQWMLGMRGYLQISNTEMDFVPELMFGFGSKTAFALSANVVYNIPMAASSIKPYVGLGLGVANHGLGSKFGTNILLGANIKAGTRGEFFADYMIRNLFKNNQIAVGYRFVF